MKSTFPSFARREKMKNSHRLFLRSLMSKQFLSDQEAQTTYQKACEAYRGDNDEDFPAFIGTVNKGLRSLFLEVRRGISEDDGALYYGLVNTGEDEHAKLATDLTAHEISFFKKAMDLIVLSPTGTVLSVDLCNAASDLEKKMSITHAETLMDRLVQSRWLSKSAGEYSLGPRAMLELHPYLKRVYEDDILNCMVCHDIVIKGQCCNQCEGKIHLHCAARYFGQRQRGQCVCPNQQCRTAWGHEVPQLASTAAETRTAPASRAAVPSGSGRSRKRR